MNGYQDNITTSIEKNRNSLRRIARHDDQEFSKESIINVMERFVKSVNTMDDTILVPCRLMDLQIGDVDEPIATHSGPERPSHYNECLDSANLLNLYNMLNAFKVTLLWGKNGCERKTKSSNSNSKIKQNSSAAAAATATTTETTSSDDNTNILNPTTGTTTTKGHARRTSTASTNSVNSGSAISDSESDISTENDSGVELENNNIKTTPTQIDKSTQLALECRNHLMGLHRCLEQMTEAAEYLTARYQNDVEPV